jgi:hypothetical protein
VTEHEPSDACVGHCYCHNVDEPGTGYIRCLECGHLYRTARDLRRAYRRASLAMPAYGVPWRRIIARAILIRARNINFCLECIHDF